MASLNKVQLIGHLGKDPELRTFPSGGRVANFSVATSETWKDKTTGEKKDRTEWHNVSVLNENLVNLVEKYLRKGSKVYLEGALETQKYTDKQGVERYTTKIILRPYNGNIVLLDSKGSADAGTTEPAAEAVKNDMDDEIPF